MERTVVTSMTDHRIEKVLDEIRRYAERCRREVASGVTSPEIAAQLIRTYGSGLAKAAEVLHGNASAAMVIYETDNLADQIDDA